MPKIFKYFFHWKNSRLSKAKQSKILAWQHQIVIGNQLSNQIGGYKKTGILKLAFKKNYFYGRPWLKKMTVNFLHITCDLHMLCTTIVLR